MSIYYRRIVFGIFESFKYFFPFYGQCLFQGASAGCHTAINEAGMRSGQLGHQFIPEQKRNVVSGKKIEKSVAFFTLRDGADVSKDHNMIQVCSFSLCLV